MSAAAVLVLFAVGASSAAAASPWWHLSSTVRPAHLEPGGEGTITFRALNVGAASATPCSQVEPGSGGFADSSCESAQAGGEFESTPIVITADLPSGIEILPVSPSEPIPNATLHKFPETDFGPSFCSEPAPHRLRCTYPPSLGPLLPFEFAEISVAIKATGAVGGPSGFTVSGGAAEAASFERQIQVAPGAPEFGVEEGSLAVVPEEEGGAVDTQAGSHPFQLTTDFALNQNADTLNPPALARNLVFELPPGLLANATAVGRCSDLQFLTKGGVGLSDQCSADSAVGVIELNLFQTSFATGPIQSYPVPVFNLVPTPGEPARFGFYFLGAVVTIDFSLRSDGDYGATATVRNATQIANFMSETLTLWGAPGDPAHDSSRGWACIAHGFYGVQGCAPSSQTHPTPLLQLPTSCQTPFGISVEGVSWPTKLAPAGFPLARREYSLTDRNGQPLSISACDKVPFEPTIAAESSRTASAPTGLGFDIDFEDPGIENAGGIVNSQIKRAAITLPQGFTTNPAVANGLGACTAVQYEAESLTAQGCPESSRIGTVEIESPLVEPKIDGSLYVAKQGDNVNGNNLLTVYLVAKSPELGVIVKQALKVTPDPQTGQLKSEVDNVPRLPFSHLHLAFRSGPRAPLITPSVCGQYAASADLYPWSNPTVALHREATLTVNTGNGGPCASSESQLPNHPTLSVGSVSPIAGAYSPFVFEVQRGDGDQKLSTINATLPEGLLGKLAGLTECSNAAIKQAEGRGGEGQGALELASPSCPASSQVGVVNVGTGAGPQPYYVQGKAYLAGPYKGAPLSLAIITPAVVGPFDLGTIVVRTALYVNETTAQITAKSDPIPTIVHGLPTVVQSIALNMNKPNFTLNPTSCEPKQITGQAISTLGSVAPLSQRFQVGACNALGFKPNLKINLKGATKRGRFPALTATLIYPKGAYANIRKASVALPHSEFLAQNHIKTICTRVQFNAGAGNGAECPKGSIYGEATATSPLLDKALSGPVYLRSSSHPLPDLVAALHGQIDVALVGRIDSKNGGIRTTFGTVPDAPVSKFTLQMQGGKKGLLVNSTNICRSTNRAVSKLTAQNGKTYDTEPAVTAKCGKGKKGNHGGAHHR